MHPIESKIALLKAKMIAVLKFNQQDYGDRIIFLDSLRRGRSLCKKNRLK
jgi:hypothetical protein